MTATTTIAVLDVETTGEDPATCRVAEVALVWVEVARRSSRVLAQASALTRVREPYDVRARAVHHLHPARLARARPAPTVLMHLWRAGVQYAACHMASFDTSFVAPQMALARLALPPAICTWRVALHLWPDAPSHSLQALRYHLGLRVRPPGWAHPHRALHDALVAAELLRLALREHSPEELLRLTGAPVLQRVVRFGQHRGSEWQSVPGSYLRWMRRTWVQDPGAFDLDARYTCEAELARRLVPRTAAPAEEEAADEVVKPATSLQGAAPPGSTHNPPAEERAP